MTIRAGTRKLVALVLGLVFLLVGLGGCLAFPAAGTVVWTGYAAAVVGLVTVTIGGNAAEHFAANRQEPPK